jgi:hypothetical protein
VEERTQPVLSNLTPLHTEPLPERLYSAKISRALWLVGFRAKPGLSQSDLRRVRAQVFQRNKFKRADVRSGKHHSRRTSSFKRFLPPGYAQTPSITAYETRKAKLRNGRDEIVANRRAEAKELLSHHRAYGMQTVIARTGAAVAITIKASARLPTARFELTTKNIR